MVDDVSVFIHVAWIHVVQLRAMVGDAAHAILLALLRIELALDESSQDEHVQLVVTDAIGQATPIRRLWGVLSLNQAIQAERVLRTEMQSGDDLPAIWSDSCHSVNQAGVLRLLRRLLLLLWITVFSWRDWRENDKLLEDLKHVDGLRLHQMELLDGELQFFVLVKERDDAVVQCYLLIVAEGVHV